jgi:hypothetical protein
MTDEPSSPKQPLVEKPVPSARPPRASRQRHKTAPETPFSRLANLLEPKDPKPDAEE